MALTDQVLPRLRRTMLSILRIGDINVKDSSGVVQTRNSDDTAFADLSINRIRVQGDNATNAVIFDAPAGLSASPVFTLPAADGVDGQVLLTDGSGNLSFEDIAANADLQQIESFTDSTSSPLAIFTPPANSRIMEIMIHISVAAAASGASLKVGDNAGDDDRYFEAVDIDMEETGTYIVRPLSDNDVGGSPVAIELVIVDGSQTFAGDIYVKYSTPS